MLGMDLQAVERALPAPTLNLEHQKKQALLDKEDRERQAREREARVHIEALLDKRDEEAKQQHIRQKAREATAAAEAAAASQPRATSAVARAPVAATATALAAAPVTSRAASALAPVAAQPAPAAAPAAAAQLSPWDEEARRALQPMRPMAARPGAAHGWETGWDLPCTAAPRQPLQRTLYHALREEEDALREEDGVLALQARARGRAVRREREEDQRLEWFGYYLRVGAGQGQATPTSSEPIPADLLPPGTVTSWYEAALELATSTAEQAQVAAALRDATGGGGGAPRRYTNLAAPGAATGGFAPDDFDLCPDAGDGGELGEGWRQIDDPEVGTYFFNFRTGDSVWERAQTGVAAPPLASAQEVVLATAAIRLQACARGRAARHRGASLRATALAAIRLQGGRAVHATPMAKHVPSMPQRQSTIDARLQASVKSDEGHMPAVDTPLAGMLATPESLQQQPHAAAAPEPSVPGGAQVPSRDDPAQLERPPSPSPSAQQQQSQPVSQPQPQPTDEAAKLAERVEQVDTPAPAWAPTPAPAPPPAPAPARAPAPSKAVKAVTFADSAVEVPHT